LKAGQLAGARDDSLVEVGDALIDPDWIALSKRHSGELRHLLLLSD